jgi:hypothetical protein
MTESEFLNLFHLQGMQGQIMYALIIKKGKEDYSSRKVIALLGLLLWRWKIKTVVVPASLFSGVLLGHELSILT